MNAEFLPMSPKNNNFKQDAAYLGFLALLVAVALYALTRVSK